MLLCYAVLEQYNVLRDKLSGQEKVSLMFDLINSFSKIKDSSEAALFLQDLLTANEIKNLCLRLRIARLLLSGNTQREVCQLTHSSLATVNKVNIWLNQGGEGFKRIISKLPIKYKMPQKLPPVPIEFNLPGALLTLVQYTMASKQDKLAEKFLETTESKNKSDRSLRKIYSEYYKKKTKR